MSEFIDLTCPDEFEFSDMEDLTEEDLAAIDVIEVQRQAQLINDFPNCRISSPDERNTPKDIVRRALEKALSSEGEVEMVVPSNGIGVVSAEESSGAGRSDSSNPTAKKSSAAAVGDGEGSDETEIRITVKASGVFKTEPPDVDGDGKDPMNHGDDMDTEDSAKNTSFDSGFGEEQRQQQQQQYSQRRSTMPKFSFQGITIPSIEELNRNVNLSVASQISKAIMESSSAQVDPNSIFKNGEGGFVRHDFPSAIADELRGPDPSPLDIPEGSFISVRELAIPENQSMRTIPVGVGLVPMILVEFVNGRWKAPELSTWEEAVNVLEMKIIREYPALKFVMAQAKRWRGCGSFSLRSDNVALLEKWRDVVPLIKPSFNTFPRDALLLSEEVTIMLMDDLKTYKLDAVPDSLFTRNTSLRGQVRITFSKKYGPGDVTSMLQSKDGWRLCYMEGNSLFMQSLAQHSESDRFKVGCGSVTIRGGLRKPSFLSRRALALPWSSRRWSIAQDVPLLQSLVPVYQEAKKADSLRRSQSDGNIPKSVSPSVPITRSKPRTRSERLKLQKEKKEAFKKKMNKMKSSVSC